MSYQVLARKYRPRTFNELVGQEHVSRALTHALDQDRLHHAYLFTGTRGVGKTTIARILSRCLNCEEGVSSQPCGVCPTCKEIGEGRFVDLIEVDAASRTKVEDTRELLENVQYAPTRGRYKVYLIDEVHMLSAHSFNALLKTLEEPPPHVKFLLATTDPQKMPVTILSRCLQFSLKALPAEQIAGHLKTLLEREMIRFEEPALLALGRAAQGSMRDALSLTDQAIAFGGEQLSEQAVSAMLGTVDRGHVRTLLEALAGGEAAAVLRALAGIAEHAPDELALLDEVVAALHELAVIQALGGEGADADMVALAGRFQAEQIQLYYDVALRGRRDVQEAPDARAALEMSLLRMVLFSPRGVLPGGEARGPAKKPEPAPAAGGGSSTAGAPAPSAAPPAHSNPAPANPVPSTPPESAPADRPTATPGDLRALLGDDKATRRKPAPAESPAPAQARVPADPAPANQGAAPVPPAARDDDPPPWNEEPPPWDEAPPAMADDAPVAAPAPAREAPAAAARAEPAPDRTPAPRQEAAPLPLAEPGSDQEVGAWWAALVERLPLDGTVRNLARNAVLTARDQDQWTLRLATGHQVLVSQERTQELAGALSDYFQRRIRLNLEFEADAGDTPEALDQARRAERLAEARQALLDDDTVRTLIDQFNARLDENSIRPREL
ncbi:DNA polymerase III subunit gamma/tau [Alloalcanivorax marinus]|uniref:DNA polymerase III subunit gamma/tau n=1 Tax=Alloalcanivorax marinus TaxID=1177169 RepID=UPI00195CD552|nr:DNA polymerase III subunit gamma/tau [Alloalcanivorax marinus]MBM7333603.1 DNA polymerase III subunit gamma/tau [Alloalcanivorax marinus]